MDTVELREDHFSNGDLQSSSKLTLPKAKSRSLQEFIEVLDQHAEYLATESDLLSDIMRNLMIEREEYEKFAFFDHDKRYTRNLGEK